MAPAGAGHADEEIRRIGRPVRIVEHDVKAREPEAGADREYEHRDPAHRPQGSETPHVEHHPRRDAEAYEVGERVELGAEARGALQQPRDAPIEAVENRGNDDGRNRVIKAALDRHANRSEPEAERQERDQVRQQHSKWHRAETAPAPLLAFRLERWKEIAHGAILRPQAPGRKRNQPMRKASSRTEAFKSARTVSPPSAYWPSATSVCVPCGR